MKNLIIFIALPLFIGIYGCNEESQQKDSVKSDTLHISFTPEINLNWLISESRIIEDENFKYVKDNILIYKDTLIYFIQDTTNLEVNVCSKTKGQLLKGDVAFLFFCKNGLIDFVGWLNIILDFFNNCNHPERLLDFLEDGREFVYIKVKENLTNEYIVNQMQN